MAAYSGATVAQTTDAIASLTGDILDGSYMLVADKEWYCGQLIQELHEQYGISVLVPVKKSNSRMTEFSAIPMSEYKKSDFGNIAAVYTTMKGFNGPLKMFVKDQPDGSVFALITPEQTAGPGEAFPNYTKRWRIENFFSENTFLGINHLPSLNLNAIQALLSLKLVAYHVMDNFRNDLGVDYATKTPETIYNEFVNGVQGRIELKKGAIVVHVYNFKHERAVASIMNNLNDKLLKANVDPNIPWLGNRRLEFRFH